MNVNVILQYKLVCILGLFLCSSAVYPEVYKWVDEKGRVHYGDKRHAKANDVKTTDTSHTLDKAGRTLTLYAVADTELQQGSRQARGTANQLKAGFQSYRNTTRAFHSIIKFDSSMLLSVLQQKSKRIASASVELSLSRSKTNISNNAFFLIPSHNRWNEKKAHWQSYYEATNVPYSIRKLPFMTAPSSDSIDGNVYRIDALPLTQALAQNNMRELTLEIKLQRTSAVTDIHFHSREAGIENSPKLRIEFIDAP